MTSDTVTSTSGTDQPATDQLSSPIADWLQVDPPALRGRRCDACGTVRFPPVGEFCPNPRCASTDATIVALSRTGTIWSFTDARYQPPPPYVPRHDPYQPFAIAAVELDAERLVVIGQLVEGVGVADLAVGDRVEVVVEPLEDAGPLVWRWRPCPAEGSER